MGVGALGDEGLEVGREVLMEGATLGAAGAVSRGLHRGAPARLVRSERSARWGPARLSWFKSLFYLVHWWEERCIEGRGALFFRRTRAELRFIKEQLR